MHSFIIQCFGWISKASNSALTFFVFSRYPGTILFFPYVRLSDLSSDSKIFSLLKLRSSCVLFLGQGLGQY